MTGFYHIFVLNFGDILYMNAWAQYIKHWDLSLYNGCEGRIALSDLSEALPLALFCM